MSDKLTIAGREFRSRLIVGTGKYRSFQEMTRCHEASGADMVTVAVRRVNLTDRDKESLIRKCIARESGGNEDAAIEMAALQRLLDYTWPGNIR